MATLQHNITTVLTQNLLKAGDNVNKAKYISIANVGSNTAYVDLLFNKQNKNYYLLKEGLIPVGSTLTLNQDDNIAFDNTINGFSLRVQVDNGSTAAVPVDIIITR